MLSRIPDRNVRVIYLSMLLVSTAYGIAVAVLSLHLTAHGIPKLAMGGLASAFALGLMVCSGAAGWLVARVGPKRVLAGALFGYAVCVSLFPLWSTVPALTVARFFDGASSAFIWVAAETALLAVADRTHKGVIMSGYAVAFALGYVIGPLVASGVVHLHSTSASFLVSGALGLASSMVVARGLDGRLQHSHDEAHGDAPVTDLAAIAWRIKTSCAGAFAYGYFQASVVLFLPLFLIESRGVPEKHTIFVTAFFAAGMLGLTTTLARLGDRHGHLRVMALLGLVGASMVGAFVALPNFALMCAAVFIAGATLASISPLSLALQGVVSPPQDLGRANALYNAAYAVGILLGPPVSGAIFQHRGGVAMLLHLTALWLGFVAIAWVFAADDPRARARAAAPVADTELP